MALGMLEKDPHIHLMFYLLKGDYIQGVQVPPVVCMEASARITAPSKRIFMVIAMLPGQTTTGLFGTERAYIRGLEVKGNDYRVAHRDESL